MTGNALINQLS